MLMNYRHGGGVCDVAGQGCYHPIACSEGGCVKQRWGPGHTVEAAKRTPSDRATVLEEAAKVADKRAKAHQWSFSRAVEFKNGEHQTRFAVAAREAEELAAAIRQLASQDEGVGS